MSKILSILIFLICVVSALSQEIDKSTLYEIKILSKLVKDITQKNNPKVYFLGVKQDKIKLLRKFANITPTFQLNQADFVFIKNLKKEFDVNVPTLALDFNSLKECHSCVGVFSWKNGRPILILFQENLNKFRIVLPEEYRYFIESKIMNVGKR